MLSPPVMGLPPLAGSRPDSPDAADPTRASRQLPEGIRHEGIRKEVGGIDPRGFRQSLELLLNPKQSGVHRNGVRLDHLARVRRGTWTWASTAFTEARFDASREE